MEQAINSMGPLINQMPYPGLCIGEEPPYISQLSNLAFTDDKLGVRIDTILDFEFKNFGKLLQAASSIGSVCLSHKLGFEGKQYFLGEKLRIRKLKGGDTQGALVVSGTAIAESKRKGKAILDIYDKDGSLRYKLELDMNVFSRDTFSRLLKEYSDNTQAETFTNDLPPLRNDYIHDDQFNIFIDGFSREQVVGHFTGYPIVPAVFIVNCLISGIRTWFKFEENKTGTMQIDSMEIFATRAIPINMKLNAETIVTKLTHRTYMFVSQIKDLSGQQYGAYIMTVDV